jgi:hypothetical protein
LDIGENTIAFMVGLKNNTSNITQVQRATFNCNRFWLSREILDKLEETIRTDQLPATQGFFFGNDSYEEEKEALAEQKAYDLGFVEKAKDTLNKGEQVYYTCWW